MNAPTASRFPRKIACAICSIEKGENNHWFLVATSVAQVFAWTEASTTAMSPIREDVKLTITEFKDDLAEYETQNPICGNRCLMMAVERWTFSRTIDAPRTATNPAEVTS